MEKRPNVATNQTSTDVWLESVRLPFDELVSRLRDVLGARLVAYIGGVKSTRAVSQWVAGAAKPSEIERDRLQQAFHFAAILSQRYDKVTVQSWFKGLNPLLDDTAPAQFIATHDPVNSASRVLVAAEAFVHVG